MALAVLGLMAIPIMLAGLMLFVGDHLPDRGGVNFTFENSSGKEVRLISLRLNGEWLGASNNTENGRIVRDGAHPRGMVWVSAYAQAGLRQAVVVYQIANDSTQAVLELDVEVRALHDCRVEVRFEPDGPRAGPCQQYRRASYGGAWPN
ncbi:MAG: hypothetical protein IT538_13740 [Variibacter sp.]|nr:hypothetical protein [Variibacter sp.]